MKVGETSIQGEAAAVVRRADGYWMEPVSEVVGILHNGRKLTAPAQLKEGDRVRVGPMELEFNLD
jgi:predicted component of type VI protein secretion system